MGLAAATWVAMGARVPVSSSNYDPDPSQRHGGATTTGPDATPPQLSVKTWGQLGGGGRLEGVGGGVWPRGGGGIPKPGGPTRDPQQAHAYL